MTDPNIINLDETIDGVLTNEYLLLQNAVNNIRHIADNHNDDNDTMIAMIEIIKEATRQIQKVTRIDMKLVSHLKKIDIEMKNTIDGDKFLTQMNFIDDDSTIIYFKNADMYKIYTPDLYQELYNHLMVDFITEPIYEVIRDDSSQKLILILTDVDYQSMKIVGMHLYNFIKTKKSLCSNDPNIQILENNNTNKKEIIVTNIVFKNLYERIMFTEEFIYYIFKYEEDISGKIQSYPDKSGIYGIKYYDTPIRKISMKHGKVIDNLNVLLSSYLPYKIKDTKNNKVSAKISNIIDHLGNISESTASLVQTVNIIYDNQYEEALHTKIDSNMYGRVYFVQEDRKDYKIKIGLTNDTSIRRGTLQTGNPAVLDIIAYLDTTNMQKLEKDLHTYFKKYHYRGEWFSLDKYVLFHVLETLRSSKKQIETPRCIINKHGDQLWILHGMRHRIYEPAIILANGDQYWYLNDKKHRDDGPAVILADGELRWYKHGKLHRNNGPAITYGIGAEFWFLNGKLHRDDGPAITNSDGRKMWYINDKLIKTNEHI